MRLVIGLAAALIAAPLTAKDKAASPASAPAAVAVAAAAAAVAMIGPALHVSNLPEELRFYVDGLGIGKLFEMGPPQRHETMLGYGGSMGQPAIILLSDSTGLAPPAPVMGNKFDRLVMRISGISELVAKLRKLGFATTDVRAVAIGYSMAVATDPEGYKVELVESSKAK